MSSKEDDQNQYSEITLFQVLTGILGVSTVILAITLVWVETSRHKPTPSIHGGSQLFNMNVEELLSLP